MSLDIVFDWRMMVTLLFWLGVLAEKHTHSRPERGGHHIKRTCFLVFAAQVICALHVQGSYSASRLLHSSNTLSPLVMSSDCLIIPVDWLVSFGGNTNTSTGCCVYIGDPGRCDESNYGIQCVQPNVSEVRVNMICLTSRNLTGQLPWQLGALRVVRFVNLGSNQLTGTLPRSWGEMTQIQDLYLQSNQLTGTLPPSWSTMTQIQIVNLNSNQLTGTLPPSWANMTQLIGFELTSNFVTGSLPASWAAMPDLQILYLSSNQLIGTLPAEWASMAQLQALYLASNQLAGTLPPGWGNMLKLENLYLASNQLSGTLPAEWASMAQIQDLNVYSNLLTGTLPSTWASMPQIEGLYLTSNQLSGTLPSSWANMPNLQALSLNSNQLTGTLPSSWANMSQLELLYMGSNQLSGTLPASWTVAQNLTEIDLSDNMLSGELDVWFANYSSEAWPFLSLVVLRFNLLVGSVPCDLFALPINTFDVSNNFLTIDLCDAAVHVAQQLLLVLNGNTIRLLPAQLYSTPNSNLCLYMSGAGLAITLPAEVLGPRCIVVSGNNVSGTLPAVINSQLFDVSLTNVSGAMPCIQSSSPLTLVISRTNISSLPDPALCVMPFIVRLLMACVPVSHLPFDMANLLPNMTSLIANDCHMINAPMPIFAEQRLQILDLSLNDFVGQFRSRMAADAQYVNLSPLFGRPEKLSMANICPLTNPSCLAQLSAASGGNQRAQAIVMIRTEGRPCPNVGIMVALSSYSLDTVVFSFVYVGLLLSSAAVPYTFTQSDVMGSYRATLIPAFAAAGPVPVWNHTFVPLEQLLDATLVVQLGLQEGYLVFGVPYLLRFEFYFMSDNFVVSNLNFHCTTVLQSARVRFVAGSCGSRLLIGVNGTTQCAGCPQFAMCDGGVSFTTSNTWRFSASTLPLYLCAGSGCLPSGSGSICASGYSGPACDVCSEGFGNSFGSCEMCWSRTVNIIVLVLACLVGLLVLTVAVVQSCKEKGTVRGLRGELLSSAAMGIRLLSNHFSLSGPIVNMALFRKLHRAARSAVHAQATPGSLPLMRMNVLRCLFDSRLFNANSQLALSAFSIWILTCLEVILVKYLLKRGGKIAATVCVVQLLFMTIITHSAQLLQYDHFTFYNMTSFLLDPSAPGPIAKEMQPLVTDRTIDRSENAAFIAFALLTIGAVGIGLPLVFVIVYRRIGLERRDEFRYLTRKYRPETWYWEAVIALRKAASTFIVCSLFAYPVNQAYGYVVVITIYLFGHEHFSPVTSPWLLLSDRVSCAAAVATTSVLLVADGYDAAILGSEWPTVVIIALQVSSLSCVAYAHFRETLHVSPSLQCAMQLAASNWMRRVSDISKSDLEEPLQHVQDSVES